MSKVRGKDTAPEIKVRKSLFALGFRYRLNVRKIPGKPDIVLRKYEALIFVHGCFWHGHHCRIGNLPVSNSAYWQRKMERNRARDKMNLKRLRMMGWRVLTVWECALAGKGRLPSDLLSRKLNTWIVGSRQVGNIQGLKN